MKRVIFERRSRVADTLAEVLNDDPRRNRVDISRRLAEDVLELLRNPHSYELHMLKRPPLNGVRRARA